MFQRFAPYMQQVEHPAIQEFTECITDVLQLSSWWRPP